MLRDYRAGSGSFVRPAGEPMPMGHMMASNQTGANLAFGVAAMYYQRSLRYASATTDHGTDWDLRKDYVVLNPMTHVVDQPDLNFIFGGMAITLEPIESGKIGRVAIAGLALLNNVPDSVNRQDSPYLRPTASGIDFSYWGFGRVLCWRVDAPSTGDTSLIDLSDRKLQVAYTLTSNMATTATATLGGTGGSEWTTTIHDRHNIAGFQKIGNKGFCEWRGRRWVVTIPFC
jgi:hypothetical protein